MVNAVTLAVAAAVATTAFAAPALEARRRGSRAGSRVSQSSRTDKIAAGIGAAQLATDVAGLVIPKDVESADFEARDFSDDELEARDFEDLEARRFKVKTLNIVKDPKTGQSFVKNKRDLDLEDLEARRFKVKTLNIVKDPKTGQSFVKNKRGLDLEDLEARRFKVKTLNVVKDPKTGQSFVKNKRHLDLEDLEARRFKVKTLNVVKDPKTGQSFVKNKRDLEFVEVEARRRRGGGRGGPRSSTADKIQAGIDGAALATDVVGMVTAREFDLEMLD